MRRWQRMSETTTVSPWQEEWAKESAWAPEYEPWRHGGWYVTNVRYPNGGCGCVSKNFEDGKWRIVCGEGFVGMMTFPSRDAAARAERVYALTLAACEGAK